MSIHSIPFLCVQLLFLGSWWLLWLSLLWGSKNRQRIVLILTLCTALFWVYRAYHHYRPEASIVTENAFLYVGPDSTFPKRGMLPLSDRIAVEQKKEGWYYVSSSQGRGWVRATDVALKEDA